MTIDNQDQEFHPIQLFHKLVELVNVETRIAESLDAENARRTYLQKQKGASVNDILFSGAVKLNSPNYVIHKSFDAAFAALVIDDVNSIGDLLVVTGSSSTEVEQQGAGRWRVPKGTRKVVPLTGTSFSLTSLEPTAGIVYCAVYTINRGIV